MKFLCAFVVGVLMFVIVMLTNYAIMLTIQNDDMMWLAWFGVAYSAAFSVYEVGRIRELWK